MGIPYAEVIGDPIAHSKSPLIHNFWLRKLHIEYDFRATRILPDELLSYFTARREDPDWRGCSVTMPLKRAVLPHLDYVLDKQVEAVNCILADDKGLVGLNTDVSGVMEPLKYRHGKRQPICLIGTGSAARAAAAALALLNSFRLNVVARQRSEGERLLADFGMEGSVFGFNQAGDAMNATAGVINATPLGMAGFPPMPNAVIESLSGVRRRGFAFDMVYDPLRTALLAAASGLGLRTIDGLEMLVAQAAEAFASLLGAVAPRQYDAELRELLTQ